MRILTVFFFFFFNDSATTEIYTLSLHDALPILCDMHCVTRWSRLDNAFEGVPVQLLLERAGVKSDAQYCLVSAEQGFTTNLPLADLDRSENLIALKWNGEWLPPGHRWPPRPPVPHPHLWESATSARGLTHRD